MLAYKNKVTKGIQVNIAKPTHFLLLTFLFFAHSMQLHAKLPLGKFAVGAAALTGLGAVGLYKYKQKLTELENRLQTLEKKKLRRLLKENLSVEDINEFPDTPKEAKARGKLMQERKGLIWR